VPRWDAGVHRSKVIDGKQHYPEHYSRWQGMLQRCYNPKATGFKNYGGRGIRVHQEWRSSFQAFQQWCFETYETGKSLDRIDNDRGYSPENCKWSTRLEQSANSRKNTPAIRARATKAVAGMLRARREFYGDPSKRERKYCSACATFLKLASFNSCKGSEDGRDHNCRKCRSNKYLIRKNK
jgi:hypothetical protein